MLRSSEEINAKDRLDNVKELMRILHEFKSLQAYLEHISLVNAIDEGGDDNRINIMTMHAAKGLEFPVVFLPGWEEGLFPSSRSTQESGLNGLEEERRLAYVAITRAKEKLYISCACNRKMYGSYEASVPSTFIYELPTSSYEVINKAGGF